MGRHRAKFRIVAASVSLLLSGVADAVGAQGVSEEFADALRDSGWKVKRLPDGGVELRSRSAPIVAGEPAEGGAAAPVQKPGPSGESTAWERLRHSGWRVETAADGARYLYPPGPRSQVPRRPSEPAERISDNPSDSQLEMQTREAPGAERSEPDREADSEPRTSRIEGLGTQLVERGWRVEQAADGSLLLYPRIAEPAVDQANSIQPCAGSPSELVERSEVTLPVTEWSQIREIAKSWLRSRDAKDLVVGRVRRIFRVFVVSIVESAPPHRLAHQIAIGSNDGRVIVLN